jgi:hypothetical protein
MEGKVYYRPSNGTEGELFFAQCEGCCHRREPIYGSERPIPLAGETVHCEFAISDQVVRQMIMGDSDREHAVNWFAPGLLDASTRPASCCRRQAGKPQPAPPETPPRRDVPGQMPLFDGELPQR